MMKSHYESGFIFLLNGEHVDLIGKSLFGNKFTAIPTIATTIAYEFADKFVAVIDKSMLPSYAGDTDSFQISSSKYKFESIICRFNGRYHGDRRGFAVPRCEARARYSHKSAMSIKVAMPLYLWNPQQLAAIPSIYAIVAILANHNDNKICSPIVKAGWKRIHCMMCRLNPKTIIGKEK